MNLFSRFFGAARNNGSQGPRRRLSRLGIETLEDRTVPASVTIVPLTLVANNSTTFYALADAVTAAGNNGTVTVEPGAVADYNIDITQSGLTVQGDPNVPSSILPAYNISIDANNVTLKNINANFVSVNPGFSGLTVIHSTLGSIFVSGGPTGNGNNTITQNYITGDVTMIGNTNVGVDTNDKITYNTFASYSDSMISVSADAGALIQNNILNGGGAISSDTNGNTITQAPQTGISVFGGGDTNNGLGVTVSNNTITIPGNSGAPAGTTGTFTGIAVNPFDPTTAGLPAGTTVAAPNVKILDNQIVTGHGVGLAITAPTTATGDQDMHVLVQGNDFHNNSIGVQYTGANGSDISTDLGGGALGSIGGNDFRGFTATGTATAAAIELQGVASGTVLSAQLNMFQSTLSAPNLVFAGPGSIDVSNQLTNSQAFVQALYTDFLGRVGVVGDLNYWVGILNAGSTGRENVISGIAGSAESFGRIIDGYYIKYLGRQSDSGGRQFWVNLMLGGSSLESIQAGFISSQEFISSNNSDYIQGLYRTFLGRTGNGAELAYWYGQLPSLGLQGVALGFATSQENRKSFVTSIFNNYLHRATTAGELTTWTAKSGGLLTIAEQILALDEYFNKG